MLIISYEYIFAYYKIVMKIKQQPLFETIQEQDNYSIKSFVGSDSLKLRIVVKNRGKINQVYDAYIRSIQNEGKLSEYFQNLQQLNQYLKKSENIKIDTHKKVLQIISKGPTKKSNNILIAQIKIYPIQFPYKNNPDSKKLIQNQNISSQEAQEWMDTLATQIVSIIEYKSRITQKSSSLKDYITKVEMQQTLQEAKKQVKIQMAKTRNQIQLLRQSIKKLQQSNIKNIQQQKLLDINIPTKETVSKQQLSELKNTIKQISEKVDHIIQQNNQVTKKIIKEQMEKIYQTIKDTQSKSIQANKIFCKKEQMDIIIKKIQQIGSKVEYLSSQTVKKQQEKEKPQEHHLFHKPFSLNVPLTSPKSPNNRSELQKSFRGNKKASNYIPQIPVNADAWIDSKCSHFGRLSLKTSTITINSFGGAHLFGRVPIKDNSIYNIYIDQMNGKMALGVADSSYKQNLLFGEQPNKIYYQSNQRFIHGKTQQQEQGEGFIKGQIVTVVTDLKLGTILWKVAGKLRHSWQSDQLRNTKIDWVPYIKLFQKGDRIQILQ